jgi:hypothetical protein
MLQTMMQADLVLPKTFDVKSVLGSAQTIYYHVSVPSPNLGEATCTATVYLFPYSVPILRTH